MPELQKSKIKVTEAAFTCYPVKDMARAQRFYEDVLNLKQTMSYSKDGNHWTEYDLNGTTFTLGYMENGPQPTTDGACIALEMANFDEAISNLKAANVPFRMEPFETPGCWMAIVADPEGNSIIIHQLKAERCHG